MPDVRIVVPPVLSVTRPNLGAALLKAELTQARIACDVAYVNMWFAKAIGGGRNELLAERIDTRPLLAEWLFSWALYPNRNAARDADYLAYAKEYIDPEIVDRASEDAAAIAHFVSNSAQRLLDGNPKIVGFSTSFQQNTAALALARELKELQPNIVICLGGANCEGAMGEALSRNFSFLDFVFSGEADITFPAFVGKALGHGHVRSAAKRRLSLPLLDAEEDGTEQRVIHGAPVTDLDALPTPDFSEYFSGLHEEGIEDSVRPTLIFESSRGCWWGAKHHCKFCGLNGTNMAYRSKSPARVRDELAALSSAWQINSFMAADNILNPKTIDEIFGSKRESERNDVAKYLLFYEIKSNMDYEVLCWLASAGVRWVQPGIESLDDEVLKIMDKGVTALQNVRLLRNCAEIGIVPIWNLLWGFPGEGERHYGAMARMVPLIEHLTPPRGPFRIRLDRFSPYFENAEQYGFTDAQPMRGYAAIYDLPERELRDLAYFYEGSAEANGHNPPSLVDWCERVAGWRARHFAPDGRPVLSMFEVGGVGMIRDTRACRRTEYFGLDPAEVALLRHLRDPRPIGGSIAELALDGRWSTRALEQGVARLEEHGAIVIDKTRAVSIVLDYAYCRDDQSATSPHPFGQWDAASDSAAQAQEMAKTFNRGHP